MEVKVIVKIIDEFGQEFEGISKSIYPGVYSGTQISEVCEHFERACVAVGFLKESIEDY